MSQDQGTTLPSTDADAPNPFASGERIRVENERISLYNSRTGSLCFKRKSRTNIRGVGNFETSITAPSVFLPEGTRVSKVEDVTHICTKYAPKKNWSGCGPLTKDRVYWCQRCKRPYCAHHTWQALFSINRYCWWCLCIRAIELAIRCFGALFKGAALLIAWFWKTWWSLFAQ